jgi:uncharacterized Tic20 family protein
MFCHLIAFIGFIIPFGNIFGTIFFWLFKRKNSDFVNKNGKEAVNFQIFCSLLILFCSFLWGTGFGFIFAVFLLIYIPFEIIVAAVSAKYGSIYRYKFSIRLIK